MLRPLVWDILTFLFPLGLGALAFGCGRTFNRWPKWLQASSLALAIFIVASGVAALNNLLPFHFDRLISLIGGGTLLLSWSALFLLGVVWSAPNNRFNPSFLVCLALFSGCLLLIESGGALWWRFLHPDLWGNFPNVHGHLQQSDGATCSPTAAAMLLHHYGIQASEGEMAYLAGTSLFGSDAFGMARALDLKVRPHNGWALAELADYVQCVRRGEPFLAHIQGFGIGHAVLVKQALEGEVLLVDPITGKEQKMPRKDFEQGWNHTVVRVTLIN